MIISSVKRFPWRPLTFLRCFHGSGARQEPKLNNVPPINTRNIGVIAHIDAGKTTTTERMLFYSGKTSRIGNVDEGDTVTDYLPSERQRGITIQLAAITIPWHKHKINIIDTPGHADFTFEVTRSLRVLDGAITILDAVAGVEAQTEKVWRQATELRIPKIAYINKMDRPGAGFSRSVKDIISKLQTRVVCMNLPYFVNDENGDPVFSGVIDVLDKHLLIWDHDADPDGQVIKAIPLECGSDVYETVAKSRESMVETLGEFDETVIESFFENNENYMEIPLAVLNNAIKKATIANYVTPVYCGSSFSNIGVQPVMDGVVRYLPSPLEVELPEITSQTSNLKKKKYKRAKKTGNQKIEPNDVGVQVQMSPTGMVVNKNPNLTLALAFKVITHPVRGVMAFFRVYSGKLAANTSVLNTRTGKILHLKKLMLMHGDEPEEVKSISMGNIGVVSGTEDDIITGDTLVSHGISHSKHFNDLESHLHLHPIEIPPPLFNSSIEPATAGDARYIHQCTKILLREDPSLHVTQDEDLGQTVLSGMGELHLEIIKDRLVNDMKAKARLRDVAVSYKESVVKPTGKTSFCESFDSPDVNVEVELDSFEGDPLETAFIEEEGAFLSNFDNNIIILHPNATPAYMHKAISERRWKCPHTLEQLQESLVQGCMTGLQIGGPTFGLPLHSCVLRIKSWNFPVDQKSMQSSSLLEVGRRGVTKAVKDVVDNSEDNFGVLEPIMHTRVYIASDTLGEVVHDLTTRCLAVILAIEDQNESLDEQNWAREESERVFLPPDHTMKSQQKELTEKKVVVAETPLREMVGYLSKLRSLTQGRGVFDMALIGMRRASKDRLKGIKEQFTFL